MSAQGMDDPRLVAAMAAYVEAVQKLERCDPGAPARELLDLAELKTLTAMALAKRLADLGWTQPARQPSEPAGERA